MILTIGDNFTRTFSIFDYYANTTIILDNTYTINAEITQDTYQGNTLPGVTASIANGSLVVTVANTDTVNYPEGPANLLYKITSANNNIYRGNWFVNIIIPKI